MDSYLSDWTIEKALAIGVTMEEGAIKLYTESQAKVKSPGSKQLLKELAEEEKKHREFFMKALENPEIVVDAGGLQHEIIDLKVTDRLVDTSLSPDADYQEILIFAAKSEKIAHDFYMALAQQFNGHNIGEMWANFAKEELKHKHKLEAEYDDVVLAQM